MSYDKKIQQLQEHHSVHLPNMVNPELCKEIISHIENTDSPNGLDSLLAHVIGTLTPALFNPNTLAFLDQFYREEYEYRWPMFDIIEREGFI